MRYLDRRRQAVLEFYRRPASSPVGHSERNRLAYKIERSDAGWTVYEVRYTDLPRQHRTVGIFQTEQEAERFAKQRADEQPALAVPEEELV
jgi:hypothetical protein